MYMRHLPIQGPGSGKLCGPRGRLDHCENIYSSLHKRRSRLGAKTTEIDRRATRSYKWNDRQHDTPGAARRLQKIIYKMKYKFIEIIKIIYLEYNLATTTTSFISTTSYISCSTLDSRESGDFHATSQFSWHCDCTCTVLVYTFLIYYYFRGRTSAARLGPRLAVAT